MPEHEWHPFTTKDPSSCTPVLHRTVLCSYLVYQRWLALPYLRNPIFFTEFHWVDEGNVPKVTTRSDLISVYAHHVREEIFYVDLLDLLRTPSVALHHGEEDRPSLIEAVRSTMTIYRNRKIAVYYFLGRMNDRERSGTLPLAWHNSKASLDDPKQEHHALQRLPGDILTTFSFRLSEELKMKEGRLAEDPSSDMRPGWVQELLKRLPKNALEELKANHRRIDIPAMPWVGFVESAMEAKTQDESTSLPYSAATTIAAQSLDTSIADIERQPKLDDRTVTQRHTWQIYDS